MLRRGACILLAIAVQAFTCVSGASAREYTLGTFPLRLDVTSTTGAAWRRLQTYTEQGDSDYGELTERLNVALSSGPWMLGLRFDSSTFFRSPSPLIKDRYILEKAWIGWTGRAAELVVGDAYVSLGRGLTLSLRKLDELGVDTTLRGVKVLVHQGVVGATLLAGYANVQNLDEKTSQSIDDPYDLIAGGQLQLTAGPVTFGGQGSAVAFRRALGIAPGDPYEDRMYQYGPALDAPRLGKYFGLYLEGIGQLREVGGRRGYGYGAYGAATVYAGPVTILLEGKAYGKLAPLKPHLSNPAFSSIAYNNLPTLERVLQPLEHSQSEVVGGRVRADWQLSSAARVFANYGQFRDLQGYADPREVGRRRHGDIFDPYFGVEGHWNEARSRASLMAGRRLVELLGTRTNVRVDDHVQADIVQMLSTRWSIELHLIHAERKKFDSQVLNIRYREGTLILNLRYQPHLGVSGIYDYTTDPTQQQVHYFSGSLDWDITPSSSLRLFAGSQRGGLKCISGVCRTVPPFEGVRIVATVRI